MASTFLELILYTDDPAFAEGSLPGGLILRSPPLDDWAALAIESGIMRRAPSLMEFPIYLGEDAVKTEKLALASASSDDKVIFVVSLGKYEAAQRDHKSQPGSK